MWPPVSNDIEFYRRCLYLNGFLQLHYMYDIQYSLRGDEAVQLSGKFIKRCCHSSSSCLPGATLSSSGTVSFASPRGRFGVALNMRNVKSRVFFFWFVCFSRST